MRGSQPPTAAYAKVAHLAKELREGTTCEPQQCLGSGLAGHSMYSGGMLALSSAVREAIRRTPEYSLYRLAHIHICHVWMILGQICLDFEASLENQPNLSRSWGQPNKMPLNSPIIMKIYLNTHNGLHHLKKLFMHHSSSE